MSELGRRRASRDLKVSRGHLWAGGTVAAIGLLFSFLVGYSAGKATARPEVSEINDLQREELVELLARVEASSTTAGAAERLTYPDALSGELTEVRLPDAPREATGAEVSASPFAHLPHVGAPPAAGVGVEVLRTINARAATSRLEMLAGEGLPVWARVERSGGVDTFAVGVGPWESEAAGRDAVAESSDLLPLDYTWLTFEGPSDPEIQQP